jgi:hypothetical protein
MARDMIAQEVVFNYCCTIMSMHPLQAPRRISFKKKNGTKLFRITNFSKSLYGGNPEILLSHRVTGMKNPLKSPCDEKVPIES